LVDPSNLSGYGLLLSKSLTDNSLNDKSVTLHIRILIFRQCLQRSFSKLVSEKFMSPDLCKVVYLADYFRFLKLRNSVETWLLAVDLFFKHDYYGIPGIIDSF
jgi:hypothetical protein